MNINEKMFLFGLSLLGIQPDTELIDHKDSNRLNYISSKSNDFPLAMIYSNFQYITRYDFQIDRKTRFRLMRQKAIPKLQENYIFHSVFWV
jgi:hypothetical protein